MRDEGLSREEAANKVQRQVEEQVSATLQHLELL